VFGREQHPAPDAIEVRLGPRASFNGQLRCDGSVRIDGVVEGGIIQTPANVIVGPDGKVIADIEAKTVSVSGAVKGTITADRVELLNGGRIWGTVKVRTFLLDDGGFLRGELVMEGQEAEEPFVIPPPADDTTIPVVESPAIPARE